MIAAARPRRFFFGRSGFGALGGFSCFSRRGFSARGFFSLAFFPGAGAGVSGSSGGSPANFEASSSSAEKSLS